MAEFGNAAKPTSLKDDYHTSMSEFRKAMKRWTGIFGGTPRPNSRGEPRPPPSAAAEKKRLSKPTPPSLDLARANTSMATPVDSPFTPRTFGDKSQHPTPREDLFTRQQTQHSPLSSPLAPISESGAGDHGPSHFPSDTISHSRTHTPILPSTSSSSKPPSRSATPTPSISSRTSTPNPAQQKSKRNTAPAEYYVSRPSSRAVVNPLDVDDLEGDDMAVIKPSTLLPKSTITTTITATAAASRPGERKGRGLMYRLSTRKRWSASCGPGGRMGEGRR